MIGFPRRPEVEFFLGQWRDVSSDVRQGTSIVETRGRKDWATKISPARCTLTLDDGPGHGAGAYDPDNPLGLWFGILGRNTPMRYALRYGLDVFSRANQADWGASPDMGNWSTFSAGTASASIFGNTGRHSITVNSSFVATKLDGVVQRNVEAYAEWTVGALTVAGGSIEPAGLMLRGHTGGDYWLLRASINTANMVTLQIMRTGATVVIGPVNVVAYPTTGTDMGIRFQAEGDTLRGKVWRLDQGEPLAWTLEATVINEDLGSGWVGVRSGVAGGNANGKPVVVTVRHFRVRLPQFIGETATLESQSTVDHADMRANVEAASIRRRLAAGEAKLETAIRRFISRGEAPVTITDYWPLDEDNASATRAANALGGLPTRFIRGPVSGHGAVEYGLDATVLSAPKAAQLSTDGRLAMATTASRFNSVNGFGVTWLQKVGANSIAFVTVDQDDGSQLQVKFDGVLVTYMRNAVTLFTMTLPGDGADTSWHMIGVGTVASGGSTRYGLALDDLLAETTVANATARPTQLAVFADTADNSTIQLSNVAFMADYLFNFPAGSFNYSIMRNIYLGRPDEKAGVRFGRLCGEEGVPYSVIGDPTTTPAVGPQRPLPLLTLTDECIDVDQGSAFDPRGSLGLGMRTHRSMTARSALVTLDYIGQVAPDFKKNRDDQGAKNDVTAKRPGGGSYRVQQLTGPRNVQDPGANPDAVGRYDSTVSPEPNVTSDVALPNQASWRVHMGTVDEPRYPTLTVNLAAEDLQADAPAVAGILDIGTDDPITVTGASARNVYDDIRLVARGYVSTVDTAYQHKIVFNCEPYAALDVGVYGATDDRYGSGTSVLAAGITNAATSFTVNVTSGEPWTTAAGQFPMDIMIGGERIRLSGISGAGPHTFTVASGGRGINGVAKAHAINAPVTLFRDVYYGH
jgi:hypothetical protein